MAKSNEDGANVTRAGTCRKRPLVVSETVESLQSSHEKVSIKEEESDEMELYPPLKYSAGDTTVLDEIDLHFQRSLSKVKTKWKSTNEDKERSVKASTQSVLNPHVPVKFRTILPKTQLNSKQVSTTGKLDDKSNSQVNSPNNGNASGVVITNNIEQPFSGDASTTGILHTSSERTGASLIGKTTSAGILSGGTNTTAETLPKEKQKLPVVSTSVDSNEVNVVSSRIVNPSNKSDAVTLPSYRVLSNAAPCGTVQVIDLTRQSNSVPHHSINTPTTASATGQNGSLSLVCVSQVPKDAVSNSLDKSSKDESHKEFSPTLVTRNGSSSSPPKGTSFTNPVVLLPTSHGTSGPTMMMQPQPYILVNPSDMQQVNQSRLIGTSMFCGGTKIMPSVLTSAGTGGGYILLPSSPSVSNSLFQFVSPSGVTVTQAGAATPVSQQFMVVNTPAKLSNPPHLIKACDAFTSSTDKNEDINVMPASVEDHFAKALGDQWSKLNSSRSSVSSSPNTIVS